MSIQFDSESDKPTPAAEKFDIADTTFTGKYVHVIRLNYPCGNIEDAKDSHGEPPTLKIIASILARHRRECDQCA